LVAVDTRSGVLGEELMEAIAVMTIFCGFDAGIAVAETSGFPAEAAS